MNCEKYFSSDLKSFFRKGYTSVGSEKVSKCLFYTVKRPHSIKLTTLQFLQDYTVSLPSFGNIEFNGTETER